MWLRPPLVAGTVLIVENAIKLMVLQKLSTSLPLTSVHLVQRKYESVNKCENYCASTPSNTILNTS
jgi:hypothetical protein